MAFSLGALFFGDHQFLGSGFYTGTAVILASVIAQPWLAGPTTKTETDVFGKTPRQTMKPGSGVE